MSNRAVDILIVGGGLVGAPLALALAGCGWSVAVIDREVPPVIPADPLDQRCTALSLGTARILDRWGLWSAVADDACAIRSIQVSQAGSFGATRLSAAEEGVASFGAVIENRRFLAALQPLVAERGVRWHAAAEFESLDAQATSVQVVFTAHGSRREIEARLVIAVDGVGSRVRTALGIGIRQIDYQQMAVLGTLELERPLENRAFERFTASGPFALLPRPGPVASFVRVVTEPQADSFMGLGDEARCAALQQAFGDRLGRFSTVGPCTRTPLVRIEARRQFDQRTVLLGNAARLLHPVAGQGYNLALRDADALLTRLAGGRDAGYGAIPQRVADPGASVLLGAFVRERRSDQQRTVALTDTLARLFRGHASLPAGLRAAALVGLDSIAPLRNRFAQLCMGL